MEPFPRWDLAAGAVALVIAVLGGVIALDAHSQRTAAQDYLANGVEIVADQVELHVDSDRRGEYIDEVEVAFTASAESRRALLTRSLMDAEGNGVGVHPPDAGSRYAAPLTILYKPEDPTQVIALVDAEDLAAGSSTPAVAAGMVSIGGTVVIMIGIGMILSARLRGRRSSWRVGRPRRD